MTLPAVFAGARVAVAAPAASRFRVYFGADSRAKGQGIYACSFDARTGKCGDASMASDLERPTWLTASPDGKRLYSVSELGNDGKSSGFLASFAIDRKTGSLERINQVSSDGGGPTYVGLDKTGKVAVVANFGGGSVASFRIGKGGILGARASLMQHTGKGPNRRQTSPHAHAALVSPDNRFVLSPDLGADRVFIWRLDAARGTLAANDPPFVQAPAGFGPRHLAFHPSGKLVYLMNELTAHVIVFSWDPTGGSLKEIQTVDLCPEGYLGDRSGAEVKVDRAGRFLYSSHRADNSLAVFAIDPAKGTLTVVDRVPSGGKTPWSFTIDPTGGFLLVTNKASDEVAVFRVDAQSGRLTPTGDVVKVPAPACAVFVAA